MEKQLKLMGRLDAVLKAAKKVIADKEYTLIPAYVRWHLISINMSVNLSVTDLSNAGK